ncbi:MAG: hypothetical protein KF884_04990 [Fimbriimonadaceae bacterium]|nr:hypothetical protein [Fimbriimonadaceae bacterium]QYK59442.1 MAG: hypothetical protein KF884_04990 [Fimbriimonadaceae bacterium]
MLYGRRFPVTPKFKRLVAGSLKVCPVCGTLVTQAASHCFVCAWQGRFLRDPWIVGAKLAEIAATCPELTDVNPN